MFHDVGTKRKVDCVVLGDDGEETTTIKVEIGKEPDVLVVKDTDFVRKAPNKQPDVLVVKDTDFVRKAPRVIKKKPNAPAPVIPSEWSRLLRKMKDLHSARRVVDRQPVIRSMTSLWSTCRSTSTKQQKQDLLRDMLVFRETTNTLQWEWRHLVLEVIHDTPGGWDLVFSVADKYITNDYFCRLVAGMGEQTAKAQLTSLMPQALVDSKTFLLVTVIVNFSTLHIDDALVAQLRSVDEKVLLPVADEIPYDIAILLLRHYMNSDLKFPRNSTSRHFEGAVIKSVLENLPVVLQQSTRLLSNHDVTWLFSYLPLQQKDVLDELIALMIRFSLRLTKQLLDYLPRDTHVKIFKAYVAQGHVDLIEYLPGPIFVDPSVSDEVHVLLRSWVDAGKIDNLDGVPGSVVYRVLV